MPMKASIHLPNLLQWPLHPMFVLLRSSLGQLIVLLQIMSHPASTILAFQSLTMVKITLLLAMANICLLLIQVIPLFPPLILPCILIVFLEFLLLYQILPLSIKSTIITIAGAILMKISFPFRLWPRGKCFTGARVKVEFIPSILIKHQNFFVI